VGSNGQLRQDGTAADLITGPAAALSLLAGFQRLDPGDLLLTRTPGRPGLDRWIQAMVTSAAALMAAINPA
jgi:2-keto-4-pentenoate hydratase/2-oxohepta-3-ene-1,7-dioic acid hydratase in catechol pathway